MIGTKLAHYEITSHLGTGGMGIKRPTRNRGNSVELRGSGQVRMQTAITLEGDASRQTITNSSGQYAFTGVPASGSYTLTPSALETVFSPPQTVIANLNQNEPDVNFRIVGPDELPPPAVIPELQQAMTCVRRRAGSLLVIAHP